MKNTVKVEVVYDFKHEGSDDLLKNGTVHVRVYLNRKRTYVSTGVRVLPSQWSDDLWVVGRRDAAQLNSMIQEQLDKCRGMVGESVNAAMPTLARVPDAQRMKVDRSNASFLEWMRRQIDECGLSEGTVRHHNTVYESLCAFGKIRRFEDVTADRLNDWLRWVGKRKVQKMDGGNVVEVPITQVTIYGYWKRVKKWIGVAQEQRLLPMDAMLGVRCDKGRSKAREFLSDGEIKAWMGANITSVHLSRVRDLFLVECGTGLAYRDMMETDFSRIEKIGGSYTLQGRRIKTGEQFFLVILPFAYSVLEKWGFVLPSISNQKYNAYLGQVAEIVGIDKHITSHVGRHTYACYCLRHGVRIEAVQRTLGHADIKTTQVYAKLVDQDVVEAFKAMR